jgi:hypothetical protein
MKKKIVILVSLILSLTFIQPLGADEAAEELARTASDAWLALVDQGEYAKSWQEAAPYFRKAVAQEQWVRSMNAFRKPLGNVLSRKLRSKQYTKTLPGAPDGHYVVLQYETSFENKQFAVETVTPMLDSSGQWRVSGYYIK